MQGLLYVCATPIGNLEDITLRALRVLKEVDLIAAEDTRNTVKLLNYYNISTPLTSYHENNKSSKTDYLIKKLLDGFKIALVSDAGMPGISDPGSELIRSSFDNNIKVEVLPGASALTTSAVFSGLRTRRIAFEGFLPSNKKRQKEVLSELSKETRTIVIYEAPHHLKSTLEKISLYIEGTRQITICKELTKKHENRFETTLENAVKYYETNEPKGEYVIVISGKDFAKLQKENKDKWEEISIEEHMNIYLKDYDKKEAMKHVAKDRGISKREIYNIISVKEKNND